MKRSDQLKKQVQSILFWWNKLYGSAWRQDDLNDNENDREVRRQILVHLEQIKKLVRDHYGPKIGAAVFSEIE